LAFRVVVQRVLEVEELTAQRHRVRLLGREVVADAVVIASGATRNPVRRSFDRHVRRRMVALGVRLERGAIGDLGHRLLVDRAPNGWWYAIADGSATDVVYCTDAGLAKGAKGIRATWREACVGAADWLPSTARLQRPRVRPATVGMGAPSSRGRIRLVGDAALAVDPLSGHGITLALECAARWNAVDYADWIADTAHVYERMERDVYRAASGVGGPFWDPRRA
jgi:flavin-dependent dehydrogenase